jgi:hypothetical protein
MNEIIRKVILISFARSSCFATRWLQTKESYEVLINGRRQLHFVTEACRWVQSNKITEIKYVWNFALTPP